MHRIAVSSRRCFLFHVAVFLASSGAANAQSLPAVFDKAVPETVRDLQAIEAHVQKLVDKLAPATVCIRVGNAQGSGVIIDRQGHILTAGHVSGAANREAVIIFHDGTRIKGKTLGANNTLDSGMAIITEKGDFPFVEMAQSAKIRKGDWCLALGHPGGYKPNRAPSVRVGRVQNFDDKLLLTDCTLVGGDSGGPLFDMHGRVIGIHSRIGGTISANLHVPVDTFRDTWVRLAGGEVWGAPPPLFDALKPGEAYLGLRLASESKSIKIESVTPGSPADKAGLRPNDVIVRIDRKSLASSDELGNYLKVRRPGMQINVHIQRGSDAMTIAVTLGKRES